MSDPGRYHLYVMEGCPWAHRTLIVRALKGLDGIGVTALHHHLVEGVGWTFAPERPDPVHGASRLAELYERARPGYDGRVTVPLLWDRHADGIASHESAEIMRLFDTGFDDHARHPEVRLVPAALRGEIEAWNTRIQRDVNEGVYAAGFATTQRDHDRAARRVYDALDMIDAHLVTHRFLLGDTPTEADWRLFPTLVRFDIVYHGLFRLLARRIADLPALNAYARTLYRWPGIAQTVNLEHIRLGYWRSMTFLNPRGIVPVLDAPSFIAP